MHVCILVQLDYVNWNVGCRFERVRMVTYHKIFSGNNHPIHKFTVRNKLNYFGTDCMLVNALASGLLSNST